jgi:hypothetical protein
MHREWQTLTLLSFEGHSSINDELADVDSWDNMTGVVHRSISTQFP